MIEFDEVGTWSEVKLEILRKYASAYSTILAKQAALEHYYIDGFAGPGVHRARSSGALIEGSPTIALQIRPGFRKYFFIDLDGDKVEYLRASIGDRADVEIYRGDCNAILLGSVFPQVTWDQYRRALCLLDPYGLQLDWQVIAAAGQSRCLELFLNFPVMDMNRNALWRIPEAVTDEMRGRMTRFWGDESWFDATYRRSHQRGLFGDETGWVKGTNEQVAEAFRQRLRQTAGFRHVPPPLPMKNSVGAVVYYLYFAGQNATGGDIVEQIFERYR